MASIVSAGTTSSTALNMSADTSGVLQLASNNGTTAVTIGTDQNATFAGYINAPNSFGFKNRIINGAMVIDQRNAGASFTPTDGVYMLDRYFWINSQSGKFTGQQNLNNVTPPVGFTNYLGLKNTSAVTIGAGDYFGFRQRIEGFNFADMQWGTANAKTITLSFWVNSSITGTFGGSLCNSGQSRSYPFTYSISSANTWEQKSITIAGDTSGTWVGSTNGIGVEVNLGLGCGSTYSGTAGLWASAVYVNATGNTASFMSTINSTFYITGVQLEKGSTATSFDYRPYGTELQLCQRYYWSSGSIAPPFATGHCRSSTAADYQFPLKVTMRAAPTLSSTNSGAYMQVAGSNYTITSITAQDSSTVDVLTFRGNVASGLTAGYASVFGGGTATYINASAEL